jgi:Ca2+-binding RTX toxin-like protein
LLGGNGKDSIFGEAGNDRLLGGAQDDSLFGGADSDTLLGEDGRDALYGFTGQKTKGTLQTDGAPDTLNGGNNPKDFCYEPEGTKTNCELPK